MRPAVSPSGRPLPLGTTASVRPTAFTAPAAQRLTVALIEDIVELRALVDDWARLLDRSFTNDLTLHPDWMLTWWEVFGSIGGRSLRSVAFYDGSSLIGLAPLLARKHKYKFGIPFKRLELLASGEDEADEISSDYLGFIVERGYEIAVSGGFAKALAEGALGPWDELVLPVMNGDSPLSLLLRDALEDHGIPTTLEEKSVSPYVPLPSSWEEYLAQLKPSKRQQLRKSLRALESWAGGTLKFERVRSPEELERGKQILEQLHRERWGGAGVYRSERYRAFHDRMMPKLLELGALDLGWMSVRGEPVAAYYNFRWRRRVGFYQAGRRLDVPENARVGVTMHALLIKNAIERGMVEYDFLAGTSQYKMALSLEQRPLVTLRAARPSVMESMRRATEEAKRIRDVAAALTGEPIPEPEQTDPMPLETQEVSIVSLNAHALDENARPFFFGSAERSLFGWYHASRGMIGQRRAVVIAPPFGYENICAYPAMRAFAERLSEAGYPVLRFDFDGTGDSAGLDSDPGRVAAWKKSVGDAIDQVRALSGLDEVCVFGIRMGATIAAAAAAERGDVERLILWNPCATGRAYAREMKMFRQYAEQTGELQARPNSLPEGDEESGGFLLSKETLDDLKKLDLTKMTQRPAGRVLVLGRDDVPDDDKIARAIEGLGSIASYDKPAGYAEMMVAPHKSVFPETVFSRVRGWLGETAAPTVDAPASRPATTARAQGIIAPGVREEPIRFGAGDALFGILTEPVDGAAAGKPVIIFTNTAGNYRIGPNRMYVEMARKLAKRGISSVRMDVSGIGDSTIYEDEARNHPYGDQLARDVQALIGYLRAKGRAKRFGVAGLCSGAFVAYHAAVAEPAIESITLINPQTFVWEDGMSLDVNPLSRREQTEYYKRRLFSPEAWKKLVSGGVDPRHAVNAVRGRVFDAAKTAIAKAKAQLPGAASRGSELAKTFDSLCERGVDVHIVFAENDPGIGNLHEKVGASMKALLKRPNFTVDTIDGPDHSFTPLWAQAELDKVLLGHLTDRFK